MTIPEAGQLVLQASAMSKGGEVFVLDMGEPVKILDVAKSMVRLQGLLPQLDQAKVPAKGEISIQFTGLRPGEKLHEIMVSKEDSYFTYEYKKFYKILSSLINTKQIKSYVKKGKKVPNGFEYSSNNNKSWMKRAQLKNWINTYLNSNDFDKI